ncbi:DUF1049 domain-containing protein [Pseudomonas sp. SC11]|uniref:DUF1049 domain-containing protein n=1 Tax=Pseudomonas sp. SC11 TaxID=326927 RepID=UPI00399B0C71
MHHVKRGLVAMILLILVAIVLCFVLGNQQIVTVRMLWWSAPPMPVAVPMLVALLIGLAFGPVLGFQAARRIGSPKMPGKRDEV